MKEARADYEAGKLTGQAFKQIEDRAVDKAIALQQRARSSARQVLELSADLSGEIAHLTPTESAILKLLAEGDTTRFKMERSVCSPE